MNHPAIKQGPLFKRAVWAWQPYVLGSTAIIVLAGILLSLENQLTIHRFAVVGTFLAIGFLGTSLNLAQTSQDKHHLHQVARQMKLTCESGMSLLGTPLRLVGLYRNRPLVCRYQQGGHFQRHTMQITLTLNNWSHASLRLRGPYDQSIRLDNITLGMFSAAKLRPVGDEKLFFVGGSPIHVTTNLLGAETLRHALECLPRTVSIELKDQHLTLAYPGQIYEAERLNCLAEILSNLADAIEQKSNAWQRMTTPA